MEGEAKTLLRVCTILLTSLYYCYFIASKIPKGKIRLLFFLPTFIIFTFLPLFVSSGISAGLISFFVTYLGNFKLLLFSYNLGPLSNIHNLNPNHKKYKHEQHVNIPFLRFIILAIFPIKIKDPSAKYQKSVKNWPFNLWSKSLCFSILETICYTYKKHLHSSVMWVIYCCMLYLFLDVIIGICNKLAGTIMGVELHPPSDEPYLSTSLQDFWGRRWNLMVADVLRHTIYLPMKVFLSKYLGQQRVVVPSVMIVFLVSGLMHELIFYYLTCVNPTWDVTCFFVVNGLCVVFEGYLKKYLGQRIRIHWALASPLTIGFVMGTGYLWFFQPILRNQVDIGVAEEVKTWYESIRDFFLNNIHYVILI